MIYLFLGVPWPHGMQGDDTAVFGTQDIRLLEYL